VRLSPFRLQAATTLTPTDVVLRTCSRVHAVSMRRRLRGIQKAEVVTRCFHSLARSISAVEDHVELVRLHVVDDGSSGEVLQEVQRIARRFNVAYSQLRVAGSGNGASLRTCFQYIMDSGFDEVYLVEDDYLHYPDAVPCLLSARRELKAAFGGQDVVLHPYDCPDRYRGAPSPSLLFFSADRYWRTVQHTTGTFLFTRSILSRFWQTYMAFCDYGLVPGITEDTTINKVYAAVPCLAPIPTLAIHLQYESTIPLVLPGGDWLDVWNASAG